MGLAVRTPAGRRAIMDQKTAVNVYSEAINAEVIMTPTTAHSRVDGIVVRNGVVSEIIEVRVRYSGISLHELEHGESIFIDKAKIDVGAQISAIFNVPFVLLVYLYDDEVLLKWKITDLKGNVICYTTEETRSIRVNMNSKARREAQTINLFLKDATRYPFTR